MQNNAIIQGRSLSAQDLAEIRTLLAEHPSWNRTRLSQELCRRWEWRNEAGQMKDMACRTLLLKLQDRGWIALPAAQRASTNGFRNRHPVVVPHDESPFHRSLETLRPLRVERVAAGSPSGRLFQCLLQRYHYLGHRNCVGENLKYLVSEARGRPLACLLFGSAAWKCRPRDLFIGWNEEARTRSLRWLTNNTRFLLLPWVRVPLLASHLLSLITARLSADWQDRYGHPIHLVETFVEADRFSGTSYRAAGWMGVGRTTGRGRNAPGLAPQGPLKEVFLKPLSADFRSRLGA